MRTAANSIEAPQKTSAALLVVTDQLKPADGDQVKTSHLSGRLHFAPSDPQRGA